MPTAVTPLRFSVRACFDLARAGNFPSVISNVLAALVLSSAVNPTWPAVDLLALVVLAGCLTYAGGATLNDVVDAEFDARNRPERAIPRQVVSRRIAGVMGVIEMTVGLGLLVGAGASVVWAATLAATILAYDLIHKRWSGSVILMAGCRVLLAVTIASLPGQSASTPFRWWIGALFVYIVTLSLIARREYAVGSRGTAATPRPAAKRGGVVGRLLAFIPLVDALALLLVGAWIPALVCAAAVPVGRWAQRLAAST
jgi:4-hydroxybenzoate polyprenyltransferase